MIYHFIVTQKDAFSKYMNLHSKYALYTKIYVEQSGKQTLYC